MALVTWWYDWGMFLFLFIALGVIVWIIYDSTVRGTSAIGWRLAALASPFLIVPALVYKFADPASRTLYANLQEPFFWIGLVGGIVPVILAVAYAIVMPGEEVEVEAVRPATRMCNIHGEYDAQYPACPVCMREAEQREAAREGAGRAVPRPVRPEPRPQRAQVPVILAVQNGPRANEDYHLYEDRTTLGRSADNDIVLSWDDEVSRQHAMIRQENGRLVVHDLGSSNGTWLNGTRVRGEMMLQDNDLLTLGSTDLRLRLLA